MPRAALPLPTSSNVVTSIPTRPPHDVARDHPRGVFFGVDCDPALADLRDLPQKVLRCNQRRRREALLAVFADPSDFRIAKQGKNSLAIRGAMHGKVLANG